MDLQSATPDGCPDQQCCLALCGLAWVVFTDSWPLPPCVHAQIPPHLRRMETHRTPEPTPMYSIAEVAALLGVHRSTVSRFVSTGELKAARLGHRTVRITRGDLVQ